MSEVGDRLLATVPFARTVGLMVDEASPQRAVVRLAADEPNHNHLGGPHAGAMFTAGETASGAIVVAAFGSVLARATPLAVHAEIDYTAFARSQVTATATMSQDPAVVLATLDGGQRPEFDVDVELESDGRTVAHMLVRWTLRPVRT
ncbi:MAG: YiiD C-terminal domain-containing protein [Dermatophilaceae bacterium]